MTKLSTRGAPGVTSLAGAVLVGTLAIATTAAQAQDLMPLRMGAASNIAFGPNFIMDDDDLGIAKKHGLDLDVRVFASGVATMEGALAGDLDNRDHEFGRWPSSHRLRQGML